MTVVDNSLQFRFGRCPEVECLPGFMEAVTKERETNPRPFTLPVRLMYFGETSPDTSAKILWLFTPGFDDEPETPPIDSIDTTIQFSHSRCDTAVIQLELEPTPYEA